MFLFFEVKFANILRDYLCINSFRTYLKPLGKPVGGRTCGGTAGATVAKFSFNCCDCRNFFNKTNFISSARNSSRNLLKPRSRCHISVGDNSFIGNNGGISPSLESESAVPFVRGFNEFPFNAGSGLSVYLRGSVLGRNTRRALLDDVSLVELFIGVGISRLILLWLLKIKKN